MDVPKVIAGRVDRDKDQGEGLRCPACGSKTAVSDSRRSGDTLRRRRLCLNSKCLTRFTTFEVPLENAPMVNFEKLAAELIDRLDGNIVLLQQARQLVESARAVHALGENIR